MNGYDNDEAGIDEKEIQEAVQKKIVEVFQKPVLDMKKLSVKSNMLIDGCVREFQKLNRPYKFAVTCIVMQKTGAGCVTAAAAFWDNEKDRLKSIKWENEQVTVIVTVFAMAIDPSGKAPPEEFQGDEEDEDEEGGDGN